MNDGNNPRNNPRNPPQVCGTSLQLGPKTLVKGTDKLPKDFIKAPKYVGDEQVRPLFVWTKPDETYQAHVARQASNAWDC